MFCKVKVLFGFIAMMFDLASSGSLDKYHSLLNHSYRDSDCKDVYLREPRGFIISPGYPIGYHNHTTCTWNINVRSDEILTLMFKDLDIEDDRTTFCKQPPCCKLNWVKIIEKNTSGRRRFFQFCGRNGEFPQPINIVGSSITIKYESSMSAKGGRGFNLEYILSTSCSDGQMMCNSGKGCYSPYEDCNGHIDCPDFTDELGCGHCSSNYTACSSTSDFCYNPFTQRCNHFLDCPFGEDEMNCEPGCEGKILCSSGMGCYRQEERCNGVAQCGDASDETFCSPELCRSERGGFLCGNLRCIRETWSCDRTNDCGDGTDEINCLKNSVIAAAVIGSLICGLLLVVAVSCLCKLYALRTIANQPREPSSRETPLSQIEREFLYREPPPSYAVATGDTSIYCSDTVTNHRERRSTRHHSRRSRSHRLRNQNPRNSQVPEVGGPLIIISPSTYRETFRNREVPSSGDSVERNATSSSETRQPEVHRVAKTPKPRAQSAADNDDPPIWRTEMSGDATNTSDVFPLLPS